METFTRAEESVEPGYFVSEEQKQRDGSDTDIEVDAEKGKELWKYKLESVFKRENDLQYGPSSFVFFPWYISRCEPLLLLLLLLSLSCLWFGDSQNAYIFHRNIELVAYSLDNTSYLFATTAYQTTILSLLKKRTRILLIKLDKQNKFRGSKILSI